MQNQLLLLDDVEDLGRSGDIVSVKPGFARNFLIPQKKAVVADKFTLRLQARLKEERAKKSVVEKAEAEVLSQKFSSMQFGIEVKVDQEGRMYGSVTAADILKICAKEGLSLEKKNVVLPHPIKTIGVHTIQLRLKEDVLSTLSLNVFGDREIARRLPEAKLPEVEAPAPEETETPEA